MDTEANGISNEAATEAEGGRNMQNMTENSGATVAHAPVSVRTTQEIGGDR